MAATSTQDQLELERRARRLAAPVDEETVATLEVVAFTAAGTLFGVAASAVAEVQRVEQLTRLPAVAGALVGIVSIRGALLPVVSLAGLSGRVSPEDADAPWVVVLAGERAPVGLLAASMRGLVTVEQRSLQEPSPGLPEDLAGFVTAVTDGGIVVIDAPALLEAPQLTIAARTGPGDTPEERP